MDAGGDGGATTGRQGARGPWGAPRALGQALSEAVVGHVDDVRRRTGSTRVVVQVDEPALPAVLAGSIPTASGFSRHRSVAAPEAAAGLGELVDAIAGADADPVLHCCAAGIPWSVLSQTRIRGLSFDLSTVEVAEYDVIASWVEEGCELWPGVVPTQETNPTPTGAALTRRLLSWWSNLGYTDLEHLPSMTVTPACGLAGASPQWARTALELSAQVARNLSVEQGKMDP